MPAAGGRRLPAVPSSAGTTAIRNGVALAEIAEIPGCWWAASARAWSLARTASLANGRLLRRQLVRRQLVRRQLVRRQLVRRQLGPTGWRRTPAAALRAS